MESSAIKEIEDAAAKKVLDAHKNGTFKTNTDVQNMNFSINIMVSGAKEFTQRAGREPTYAEMRAMFG